MSEIVILPNQQPKLLFVVESTEFAGLFFSSVHFVVLISGVLFVLSRPNARLLGHS